MADPQVAAFREMLAQRPKVTDIAERRRGMDGVRAGVSHRGGHRG